MKPYLQALSVFVLGFIAIATIAAVQSTARFPSIELRDFLTIVGGPSTTNHIGGNATVITNWLALSGTTNRLSDDGTQLLRNGVPVDSGIMSVNAGDGILVTDGTNISTRFLASTNLILSTNSGVITYSTTNAPVFQTSVSTPSILTASGPLGITPAAGSGVNVTLSTTGDFIVNTNQFVVDTSDGHIGIGRINPVITTSTQTPRVTIQNLNNAGGILELSVINKTNDVPVGTLFFSNADNPNTANAGSAQYPGLAMIRTIIHTSDINADGDAGGHLLLWTKPEAGALTEQMRITSGGNVGIGTTTPGQKLHLRSTGELTLSQFEGSGGTAGYIGGVNTAANGFNTASVKDMVIRGEGPNILFGFSNVEQYRMTSAGSLGIGTTTPLATLAINGGLNVGADADPGDNNANVVGTTTTATLQVSGTGFVNDLYATNDVSALTFTDRSDSPDTIEEAYRIVLSHTPKDGRVDHETLDPLAWGRSKDYRNMSMVMSAQSMVIQDLLKRLAKLEETE